MRTPPLLSTATALVLSLAAQVVQAHGHDEAMETTNMDVGGLFSPNDSATDTVMSYFANGTNTSWMIAHAGTLILAWMFVLPIGVMLSISKSRRAILVQVLFLLLNAVGVFFGIVFNARTPDLFENNAHHKMGWVATWVMTAQVLMSLLYTYSGQSKDGSSTEAERAAFLPRGFSLKSPHHHDPPVIENHRWSGDSGQGTEPPSPSSEDPTITSEQRRELYDRLSKPESPEEEDVGRHTCARRFLRNNAVDRLLRACVPKLLSRRLLGILHVACEVIDRTILVLGFAVVATGGVTYAGIMRGDAVFNGLAHFVKGGIFFWYGLLTLGRWTGAFADMGWAWNVKPARSEVSLWKSRMPSGEFVESFVIFLYGSTNVFLEHLAAWGDKWVAQDLEHVSISIMFFGGGLCGMLIESRTVRDLLNTTILNLTAGHTASEEDESRHLQPKVYKTPMNPLPGLVILLLGLMMSSHHQHSATSTMVHAQWGSLLVGFSLARAVTYIVLYISPLTSIFPSRPPSELVAAFCLISGGLLFMASNKDIIAGLEYYDLNAMFMFTVVMGFTAFLMAWELIILAVKGWAVRRQAPKFVSMQYQA